MTVIYTKDLTNIVNGELIDASDIRAELTKIETAITGLNDLFSSEGTITGARVHQNTVQVENAFNYFISGTGATNDIIKVTTTGTPSDYEKGMRYVTNVNTLPASGSTPMKFQLDSLTVKNITTPAGTNVTSSDLTLGQLLEVIYDGTNFIASGIATDTVEKSDMLKVTSTTDTSITFTFPKAVDFVRQNAEGAFVTLPYDASGYVVSTSTLVDGATAGDGDTLIPYVANSTIYFSNTEGLTSVTVGSTTYDARQLPYSFVLYNNSGIKFFGFVVTAYTETWSRVRYTHDPLASNISRAFAGLGNLDDQSIDYGVAVPTNANNFSLFMHSLGGTTNNDIAITGASGAVYHSKALNASTHGMTHQQVDCLGDQNLQTDFGEHTAMNNSVDGHVMEYEVTQ